MRHRIKELFMGGEGYREEFRKQMRLLVTFTLGFTIAFTWRQTIFDSSENFIKWITHVQGQVALSVLASVLITLVSCLIIFLSSRWLKGRPSLVKYN